MIEDNNFKILHICSMLHKLKVSEIKYLRATYKVSYYRKIKAAITSKAPKAILASADNKWRNNLKELNRKIEQARLFSLKCQREHMNLKKKLMRPLNREVENAGCYLSLKDGKIVGLLSRPFSKTVTIDESQWEDKAQQYEASVVMDKLLTRK